jgi:hypothetical protein
MELEKIPSLIAVATFAALSLIVAHEWGYFGVIGRDFQAFFTTNDYVSELIVLIGPVFVFMMFMFVAVAYPVPKSTWGKWTKALAWFSGLLSGGFFISILLFSDETERLYLYVVLSFLWLGLAGYVSQQTALNTFASSSAGRLVTALPVALILAYGLGRDHAYGDLMDTTNQYRLLAKKKEFRSVKILRLLDKGAIVFDPETKAVEFHPREDIALLQRDAPEWETKPFACRHWGWGCIEASGTSK